MKRSDERQFVLDLDEETLKTAPGFDRDHYPTTADTNWLSNVYTHYGYTPYWTGAGERAALIPPLFWKPYLGRRPFHSHCDGAAQGGVATAGLFEAAVIGLLILANGLFSMAEFAIVSARRHRLQTLAENGDVRARAALELAAEPNRFLSTVQIGITVIGVLDGGLRRGRLRDGPRGVHRTGPGPRAVRVHDRLCRGRAGDHVPDPRHRRDRAETDRAREPRADRGPRRAAHADPLGHLGSGRHAPLGLDRSRAPAGRIEGADRVARDRGGGPADARGGDERWGLRRGGAGVSWTASSASRTGAWPRS